MSVFVAAEVSPVSLAKAMRNDVEELSMFLDQLADGAETIELVDQLGREISLYHSAANREKITAFLRYLADSIDGAA